MKTRTRIRILALLIMIPFWLLLIWFDYIMIFTDYHIDKYDNMVAIVVAGLIIFYTYILVKYFKIVSLNGDFVKISYIIPFLNRTYEFSDIESVNVDLVERGRELSQKKLIIKFKNKKEISISDFFISNFEQIENCFDWIRSNNGKNIDFMPQDYKKRHSSARLEFDKSQINEKIYISLIVFLIVSFIMIFSLNKMIKGLENTDAELWTIYLWIPLCGFLVWNILKLIRQMKKIKNGV
jgi:hypothetical protein